jgi:hypothetical protein
MLAELFIKTKKDTTGNVSEITGVDVANLEKLYNEADIFYKHNVMGNDDNSEIYINGTYYDNLFNSIKNGKPDIEFNSNNKIIFGGYIDDMNDFKNKTDMQLKNIDLITSYINVIVSKYNKVSPIPKAMSSYAYKGNDDIIRQYNIIIRDIFYKNNDFFEFYEVMCKNVLYYGRAITKIVYDTDTSKRNIPIRFENINIKDVMIDPYANDIESARYVIHKRKMYNYKLKEIYGVEFKSNQESNNKTDILLEMSDVVDYYIKITANDSVNIGYQWALIQIYNNKHITLKNNKDINNYVFKEIPFILTKKESTKSYYSKGMVEVLLPLQTLYNKVITMEDYNISMMANPPILYRGIKDSEIINNILKPGGALDIGEGSIERATVNQIPAGVISAYKESIEALMQKFTGNISVLEGERQKGTYSGNMLNTIIQLSESKIENIENRIHRSLVNMVPKIMNILLNTGNNYIQIYDPELIVFENKKGGLANVNILDLDTDLYQVDIEIQDEKLYSNQQRLEKLIEILQYVKLKENIPFALIIKLVQSIMPLFPQSIIEEVDKIIEKLDNGTETALEQPIQPQQPTPPQQQNEGLMQETLLNTLDGDTSAYAKQKLNGMTDRDIQEMIEKMNGVKNSI